MNEYQEILKALAEINYKIDALNKGYMKIPEASMYFKIGKIRLREMCEKGII